MRASLVIAFLAVAVAQPGVLIDVLIQACTVAPKISSAQVFTATSCTSTSCMYASAGSPGMCMSAGPNAAELSALFLAPCGAAGLTQIFTPQADGTVKAENTNGLCWNVDGGAGFPAGTPIILYGCGSRQLRTRGPAANDIFTFLSTSQIWANGSSLCLDASPPPHVWAWVPGQAVGQDAAPAQTMAVDDAKALCLATPHCWSISYQGPLDPVANQTIYFKTATQPQKADGWQTYIGCGINSPCT